MKYLLPLILCIAFSNEADAFGRKKLNPNPSPVIGQQAIPYRLMELAHVTTPAFYLPNGQRADFNTDLETVFSTAINSSKYFRTVDGTEARSRLVITGGITSFELDVLQLGIRIGWNKNGPIPIDTGLADFQGEVDLRLHSLSIDFKIYDRYTGQTYLANYTNETLSNLKFQVRVNLANLVGNIDLNYKARMTEAIRNGAADIFARMEGSANFHLLPWESKINGLSENIVSIDAGNIAGIRQNDIYLVYSHCQSNETSCFEKYLAEVRVNQVGPFASTAIANTDKDSLTQIISGDKVYVKKIEK